MENLSRKDLRKQSKKSKVQSSSPTPKKSGGKGKIIALLITLILIVAGAGTLYWFLQKEENQKAYNEKTTQLETQVKKDLEATGIPVTEKKSGGENQQVFTFLPTASSENIQALETDLTDLVKKSQKSLGDSWGNVVATLDMHHITDQLTEIKPTATTYKWNTKTKGFEKKELASDKVAYINQTTQKALTASDLFPEKADLLGMFSVLQQKILDSSKDGSAIIDAVLNMERPTLENLKFHYTADNLVVELADGNPFGLTEVSLPFTDLSKYINPSFVDPTKIVDTTAKLDPNKKYVSLTFDDGPSGETTPQLLKTLKEKDVKATFFNLGQNAKDNPEVLKQIIADGHELANHSYDHPVLTSLSLDDVKKQIRETSKILYLATGQLPHYVRPPYGAVNAETADAIGLPIIQWNVDSSDWDLKNAQLIQQRVIDNTYNGSVILLHDIHQFSVDAVPGIIDGLRAKGFEFITLEEMFGGTKPLYQYFGYYNGKVDYRLVE